MKKSKRAVWAVACAATALAVGGAALPSAQAAPRSSSPAGTSAVNGIPATVDPAAGLAAQPTSGSKTWTDSIYVNADVKAGGHDYAIAFLTQRRPGLGANLLGLEVADETTGWYKKYTPVIAEDDYQWSTSGLDIKAPGLSWTGDAQHMSVKISTPWGGIDLQLAARGPAFNYAGTGSWPMLGDTQYEYAFPSMRTTGTLTVDGKTEKVSGTSWLDRQWGDLPLDDSTMRWTWMPFRLPNNDVLALWDVVNSKTETAWATVMRPDGSYELAKVEPLAEGVHRTWTSPHTGKTYATRWNIEIPSLKTKLTVSILGPDDQESGNGADGVYEVPAAYVGTYEGKRVTGKTFTEQVGAWR